MKKEIIDILKCPINSSNLRKAKVDELKELHLQIEKKELIFSDGTGVVKQVESALTSESESYYYLIIDDIIMLRKDKAIQIDRKS